MANVFWRWNKSLLWALCVTAVKETWLTRVVVIRRSPAGCTGTGSGARSVNPNLPLSPPPTSAADFKSSLHSNQHRPHQQDKLPQREIVGLECHSPIRCPPPRPDKAASPTCFSLSLSPSVPQRQMSLLVHALRAGRRDKQHRDPPISVSRTLGAHAGALSPAGVDAD